MFLYDNFLLQDWTVCDPYNLNFDSNNNIITYEAVNNALCVMSQKVTCSACCIKLSQKPNFMQMNRKYS